MTGYLHAEQNAGRTKPFFDWKSYVRRQSEFIQRAYFAIIRTSICKVTRAIRPCQSINRRYRPANGTEAAVFSRRYCARCSSSAWCGIMARVMLHEATSPEYPRSMRFDNAGNPRCLSFKPLKSNKRGEQ